MTLKGDTELKGKLTRGLQNDIRNSVKGLLLSKAYEVLDEKVKKSCVS